jgi:hypothetical protein
VGDIDPVCTTCSCQPNSHTVVSRVEAGSSSAIDSTSDGSEIGRTIHRCTQRATRTTRDGVASCGSAASSLTA